MISGYQPGANITLLNVMYNNMGYDVDDELVLIYKDLNTNQKYSEVIRNPEFGYFLLNSDASKETIESLSYPGAFYRNANDYTKVYTPYRELNKHIAISVGEERRFFDNIKHKRFKDNREYKFHYKVESADHHICDYYMREFAHTYQNKPFDISKAFLDIEVDGMYGNSAFPIPEESPINAVSIVFHNEKKVYTLLLRDNNNPLIKEFEDEIINNPREVLTELQLSILDSIKVDKFVEQYSFDTYQYNFTFFDEEIQLIAYIFLLNQQFNPDFVLAWNMGFDIPYIIRRLEVLGYDPAEIMSDPDIPVKFSNYYIDKFNYNDIGEKSDFANISSKSVYLDQMIQFAAINKTKVSKYGNWKLDNIGRMVAGMGKLEYEGPIKEFPYKNYKRFVFYNIIDTLVQVAIEEQTKNIDYVFNKSLQNSTRYSKVHKQSVYLTNAMRDHIEKRDFILCTNRKYSDSDNNPTFNINLFDEEDNTSGFPGAFVADPKLINNYSRNYINGCPVNLFSNNVDLDYAALYPNTNRQFNIGHEVMIGKVYIVGDYQQHPNYVYKYYEPGAHFVTQLHSQNFIGIGNEFLNLPDVSKMYEIIKNKIAA